MEGPHLETAQELKNRLSVPISTVWKHGREGDLRFATVRVGRRMLFRTDLVNQWIEGGGGAALTNAGSDG